HRSLVHPTDPPPMSEHDTFIRAICENPADDTARLVFADWLAENGDPDRGELIRIQVALAHRDPDDEVTEARRGELFNRQDELLKRHGKRWLDPFLGYAKPASFERGFVRELEIPAHAFLTHGGSWMGMTPLTRVRFTTCRFWDVATRSDVWQ